GMIETFFATVARRMCDECGTSVSGEGCCSVRWHPDRGNGGGAGPADCPCQELDDPRDVTKNRRWDACRWHPWTITPPPPCSPLRMAHRASQRVITGPWP